MKRALLVHNPKAGTSPVPRDDIEAVLRSSGLEPIYHDHKAEDLDAALADPFDLVIAAGGDGTAADVVSSLVHLDTPIAILPLGGSNNIAHSLGVNGEWAVLPRLWSPDRWTRLDRCEADGPWGRKRFVEAMGSGVLTDAVDDADDDPKSPEEKRRNGREAFRKALGEAAPFRCDIEAADWSWDGDCLMVEVLNIPVIGSRLRFSPEALPGDGLLDVVIVTPALREALCAWAEAPDDSPSPIPILKAKALKLTVETRPFRLDDRSPNEDLSGAVDVRLRAPVKILTPVEVP